MHARTVPLINRERELAELHAALASALDGKGRLVLLAGEPGIGKTRLARTLGEDAAARGVPVWWGRGWEDGSAPAFWPWNTALRRWLDQAGKALVATAVGPWAADLAHVFPALRDRLPNLPHAEHSESDRARFRLFDLVSRFLAAVARSAGLVVVLDDLHWADRSSLKLLEFVVSELVGARILIVATYRDTEVAQDEPLAQTLAHLVREPATRRLVLGGLLPGHCADWLTAAGARGDAVTLGETLHRETNGNPFFVGEIVELLTSEEDLASDLDTCRVPHGVREVIARRLGRLGEACRATLGVAALLGDTIDAHLLAAVRAETPPADDLARAVRDRILVEVEGGDRYAFAHAIVRRVLIDELPASARAAWHARIAAALARDAAVDDARTTELVHHLAAAGTPEALRVAFEHACRGAAQAAHGLGWEEAVRLYEIALDVGARSGLLDGGRATELRLALARAHRGVGDLAAARARAEEVFADSRRSVDPVAFARAALVYAGPMPEWGMTDPGARAALEEACRSAGALDDELRARLYTRLAVDLIAANAVEQGGRIMALCDEAAAAARRANATGALAMALLGRFVAAVMELAPGEPNEALAYARDAIAAAEASGEHEYAAAARYLRAMLLLGRGEAEVFAREVDELATAAATSRVPEALWFSEVLAALRATVQGRFAEATERMERAAMTGQRAQLANAVGMYAGQRIMWHVLQGQIGEMAPQLEAFVDVHPLGVGFKPLRALCRVLAGDVAAARVEYAAFLALGTAPAERGVMARTYLFGLAMLATALRDREHAPMLYDCIARRGETWSIGGGQTLGPWAIVQGQLARLAGRSDDAARHFADALALGRRMASPPLVVRAQALSASLELARDPDAAARARLAETLAEAAESAQQLGLADVRARVAKLQAKLATSPAPSDVNVFRNEGEMWSVRYAGRELMLKDGKGPRYLASLLAAPGREVHVLQFVVGPAAPAVAGAANGDGELVIDHGGAIDDAPDERARRAYRARLAELRADLDQAERFADSGRAAQLRAELDQLQSVLAARYASRGGTRRGPAETARKAVTKVIRTQIGKLLDLHPPLGRHLRDAVRTGTVCVYAPPVPVEWDVRLSGC